MKDTPEAIGDEVGRAAVWHLDEMYPKWKDAIPRSARSSLKNFIQNHVAYLIKAERDGDQDTNEGEGR